MTSSMPVGPSIQGHSPYVRRNGSKSMNGLPQHHSFTASQPSMSPIRETPVSPPPRISMSQPAPYNANGSHGLELVGRPQMDGWHNRFLDRGPPSFQQEHPAPSVFNYGPTFKPQIYKATYSNTDVYEMEINGVAVMRRRSDSWLNATQILKVAGIEKGKRTKILEREILAGEYEKVQGGYGKYQGTWISYNRGVQFCRQYGVEGLLRPLLEHDMGQDGTVAGQGGEDTPTKEQAQAAQRRRIYAQGLDDRPRTQSQASTFFKSISSTAANAVSAIGRANATRFDSPKPSHPSAMLRQPSVKGSSQQLFGSQESSYPTGSQQSFVSESSYGGVVDSSNTNQSTLYSAGIGDSQEPPRKRFRPTSSQEQPLQQNVSFNTSSFRQEETSTEPSQSFDFRHDQAQSREDGPFGLPPLPQPHTPEEIRIKEFITQIFQEPFEDEPVANGPRQNEFRNPGDLLVVQTRSGSGPSNASVRPAGNPVLSKMVQRYLDWLDEHDLRNDRLDTPLDCSAHVGLHWAAAMGRTSLLLALIQRGASKLRVTAGGETPLMAACLTTNCYSQKNFPEVLELLSCNIGVRDSLGRTILHHIVVTAAMEDRAACSKYYLESLLEFLVRQGSNPGSQQNSHDEPVSTTVRGNKFRPMGIAQFIGEIVNAQDVSGNTALMQAVKASHPNSHIIRQLLEVQADPYISNNGGLRPVDFGLPDDIDGIMPSQDLVSTRLRDTSSLADNAVEELRKSLSSSFGRMINEANEISARELQAKQDQIDKNHAEIREKRALINHYKKLIKEELRKKQEREKRELQCRNLERMNAELEAELASIHQRQVAGGRASKEDCPVPDENVSLGFADKPFKIDASKLPDIPRGEEFDPTKPLHLTQEQYDYIQSLPEPEVLRAHLEAYRENNDELRAQIKDAKDRSAEKELMFKRLIAKLLDTDPDQVDAKLENLHTAVVSDQGVNIEEIRGALNKVRGKE